MKTTTQYLQNGLVRKGIVKGLGAGLLLISTSNFAQKVKGDGVLSVGAGSGFFMLKSSFNATYDYAFVNKFSIGLGATYTDFGHSPEGNLSRTNIGVRSLFHFGEKPNWDIYTGLRLGASIWSGSGSYSYHLGPVRDLFTIKGGSTIPTAQVLVGARYMVLDWIGINSELALGAPYLFSIGLSANINNTSKATAIIKDAYQEEIMPLYKKNVIKINAATILGVPGISYERHLMNRFSVELGSSFKFYNSFVQLQNVYSTTNVFSENDSAQKGVNAYGMVKYYITAKRNPVPKGLYLGARYNYINQTTLVRLEDLAMVKNPVSFDYEKNTEQHAGGLVIGYQQPFAKHFTVDVFAGFQAGIINLNSVTYLNKDASEEKFVSYYGSHQNPLKPQFKSTVLKVSVGYMF